MNSPELCIFTDGGSRGNPGPAAYGVVIKRGTADITRFGQCIGIATNNVAEYSAIAEAFKWILLNRELVGDISVINFYMDSQLACRQLTGMYKVTKSHLAQFLFKIREMEKIVGVAVTYTHIPREQNKEADAQVNHALDKNK